MKFNLSHFLSKRKLSFEQFLADNGITNREEFETFLFTNEFIDDKKYFENFESYRRVFEEASDATSLHLKKLCFDSKPSFAKLLISSF